MLDVMKSRRGLVASAAIVILLIMGFLFATTPSWRSLMPQSSASKVPPAAPVSAMAPTPVPAPDDQKAQPQPSSTAGSAARPGATGTDNRQASLSDAPNAPTQPSSGSAAGQSTDAPAGGEVQGPAPTFDIVRVEPSGDSVIAARGAPNADVVLLDGDVPIARAKTDANGQVALLPPALKPGEHSLTLTTSSGPGGKTVSSQSVAVSMPTQPKTAPMVALIQPNQPTTILSGPVAGSGPTAGQTQGSSQGSAQSSTQGPALGGTQATTTPTPAPASVAIRSVEAESFGSFYASGKATPGSVSRVYLNGALVASVTADSNGNWSLKINKGMKPGRYAVRLDQVDASGKVTARAEVPFDYPSQVASTAPRSEPGKKNPAPQFGPSSGPSIAGSIAQPGSSTPPGSSAQPGSTGPSGSAPAGAGGESGRLTAGTPRQTGSGRSDQVVAGVMAGSSGSALGKADQQSPGAAPDIGSGAGQAGTDATKPEGQGRVRTKTVLASNGSGQGASAGPNGAARLSDAEVASNGGQPALDDPSDASAQTVIAELVTAKVIRGDSLWRISRQMLGHGMRYTQIYAANTQQIRDPKLIYPGQVFVLPQH